MVQQDRAFKLHTKKTEDGLDGYTYQNSSRSNLTNSFIIPKMFGRECLTLNKINIVLASLTTCLIIDNLLYASNCSIRKQYYGKFNHLSTWNKTSVY